jgi:hypothetical protein
MKVKCAYSGLLFPVPGFAGVRVVGVRAPNSINTKGGLMEELPGVMTGAHHPIFDMDQISLLSLLPSKRGWIDWMMLKNKGEKKLLFLALLKATGLVEFQSPAYPTMRTMSQNIELLVKTVRWQYIVNDVDYKLPKIVINYSNRKLENLYHWLERWNILKIEWAKDYRWKVQQEKLKLIEDKLEKKIKSPYTDMDRKTYTDMLATWALDASGAPNNIRDYWRSIFNVSIKGTDIYNIKEVDIIELIEFMETELFNHTAEHFGFGTIQMVSVLSHLRKIQEINKKGLFGAIGGMTFELLDNETEQPLNIHPEKAALEKILNNAPKEKPIKEQYPNIVAYLRAKNAWELKEKHMSDSVVREQIRQLQAEQDEFNSLLAAEELENNASILSDDERELGVNLSSISSKDRRMDND